MKIIYRQHLLRRLKERKIPRNYPRTVYKKSKAHFFDTETLHKTAVLDLEYAEKLRPMAIAYDIIKEEVHIITIHPISSEEVDRKINSERWIKI
ncbi:hypothetical protein HYZ78_02510 [Candidatus Microgenomates bacterium]|nr:hypothetical protein [Candidatus Microgenomates bacterium]